MIEDIFLSLIYPFIYLFGRSPILFLVFICLFLFLIFSVRKNNMSSKSSFFQVLALLLIIPGLFLVIYPIVFPGWCGTTCGMVGLPMVILGAILHFKFK